MASAAAGKKYGSAGKLFVGNLVPSATEGELRALFSKYGEVAECIIQKKDNQPRGFAFVRMDFKHSAEKARDELNGKLFKGKELLVRKAINNATIWVGDLGGNVTNEVLAEAFSQFGEVEKAVVVTDPLTKRSKGYGFVEFAKRSVSARVLQACTEQMFLIGGSCRPVRVDTAQLEDDEEGLSVKDMQPAQQRMLSQLSAPAHFSQANTLEFEFSLKWKHLSEKHKAEKAELKERHVTEEEQLQAEQERVLREERTRQQQMEAEMEARRAAQRQAMVQEELMRERMRAAKEMAQAEALARERELIAMEQQRMERAHFERQQEMLLAGGGGGMGGGMGMGAGPGFRREIGGGGPLQGMRAIPVEPFMPMGGPSGPGGGMMGGRGVGAGGPPMMGAASAMGAGGMGGGGMGGGGMVSSHVVPRPDGFRAKRDLYQLRLELR
eukprot:jgi/Mesvir1/14279/Mv09710-RA.1